MKLEKFSVNYSSEKLQAMRLLKPEVYKNIEEEIVKSLDRLYAKSVPQSTRKYIEAKMLEDEASTQKGGGKQ